MPGDYVERFTGRGVESELVCEACALGPATIDASEELVARIRANRRRRFVGDPQHDVVPNALWFEHETIELDVPDLAEFRSFGADDRSRWLAITAEGALIEIDLDRRTTRELARVEIAAPHALHVSSNGAFAAVVQTQGRWGEIVELATDRRIPLDRSDYHEDVGRFPFAFVTHRGRDVAIFAPEWNRLAAFDLRTGEALTARPTPAHGDRHYLDYFHCGLHVSPNGAMIADNGWVWQPVGQITTWSLERWLDDNAWESEDGPSRRELEYRDDWDMPLCWIDDARFVVGGHGGLEAQYMNAIDIYDARTGGLDCWFPGPYYGCRFVFDRVLFALGEQLEVYDVDRRAGLLSVRGQDGHSRYHSRAKQFATRPHDGRMTITRLLGLDADAPWATDRVRAVAASIDDPGAQLGILGDALDEAGCTDAELLAHCRAPGPHGRHCWALDRLARR
jgi:hypothetical protein